MDLKTDLIHRKFSSNLNVQTNSALPDQSKCQKKEKERERENTKLSKFCDTGEIQFSSSLLFWNDKFKRCMRPCRQCCYSVFGIGVIGIGIWVLFYIAHMYVRNTINIYANTCNRKSQNTHKNKRERKRSGHKPIFITNIWNCNSIQMKKKKYREKNKNTHSLISIHWNEFKWNGPAKYQWLTSKLPQIHTHTRTIHLHGITLLPQSHFLHNISLCECFRFVVWFYEIIYYWMISWMWDIYVYAFSFSAPI